MLKIYDISVDNLISPSFVRCKDLRFGWKLSSDRTGVKQASYRLIIEDSSGVVIGIEVS